MNKKEHLLRDTLGETGGEAFARAAAAAIRRRHVLRRTSLAAIAVAVLTTLSFIRPDIRPTPAPQPVAKAPAFEIMSDQDLLAQLQDRPVLILRNQSRITEVVFLPETKPQSL